MDYDNSVNYEDIIQLKHENAEVDKVVNFLTESNKQVRRISDDDFIGSRLQFSKGYRRIYDWIHLFFRNFVKDKDIHTTKIFHTNLNRYPSEKRFFILSGLIVVFQLFSDGNHRTASNFYTQYTGNQLTHEMLRCIDRVMMVNDYYNIFNRGDLEYNLNNVIQLLSQCYDSIDSSSSVRQDEEQIRTSQVRDVTTNNKSTRTVKTKLTRKFGGKKYKMKKTNKYKSKKNKHKSKGKRTNRKRINRKNKTHIR